MEHIPSPLGGAKKVLLSAEGKVVRTFDSGDLEKDQKDAYIAQAELIAQGKRDVAVKTLNGISG